MLDTWTKDPRNAPNPFIEPTAGKCYFVSNCVRLNCNVAVTVAEVRREVNIEESADVTHGELPRHTTSAGQLIVALLEVEEQQRVVAGLRAVVDLKKKRTPAPYLLTIKM